MRGPRRSLSGQTWESSSSTIVPEPSGVEGAWRLAQHMYAGLPKHTSLSTSLRETAGWKHGRDFSRASDPASAQVNLNLISCSTGEKCSSEGNRHRHVYCRIAGPLGAQLWPVRHRSDVRSAINEYAEQMRNKSVSGERYHIRPKYAGGLETTWTTPGQDAQPTRERTPDQEVRLCAAQKAMKATALATTTTRCCGARSTHLRVSAS